MCILELQCIHLAAGEIWSHAVCSWVIPSQDNESWIGNVTGGNKGIKSWKACDDLDVMSWYPTKK